MALNEDKNFWKKSSIKQKKYVWTNLFVHVFDSVLVRHDVSFDELMLFHQVLNRGQVFAMVIRVQQRLHFTKPEVLE